MKTLFLDCGMGAAGDMLTAAVLELFDDKENVTNELNNIGIPDVRYIAEKSIKCGIVGTYMRVLIDGEEESERENAVSGEHHSHGGEVHHHAHIHENEGHSRHHEHTHSSLHDIEHIVMEHLNLPYKVKQDVMNVYTLIAEAESRMHGVSVNEIHFHEVGTMDAVADITAVCFLLNKLGADNIISTPVNVGSGKVVCAHGILPVPAPATAYILREIPIYSGNIEHELCTPTGAALLKYFVREFGPMPVMKVSNIGYGMGKKDFEVANCVRAMLGETKDSSDNVRELSCNLDDMTAEQLSYAVSIIMEAGALDVYTMPIGMKKSRTGIMLNVLCTDSDLEKMVGLIFKHTTTIGIRESSHKRYVLDRRTEEEDTKWGKVRKKISSGYGTVKYKYEFDDVEKIAKERDTAISEVYSELEK